MTFPREGIHRLGPSREELKLCRRARGPAPSEDRGVTALLLASVRQCTGLGTFGLWDFIGFYGYNVIVLPGWVRSKTVTGAVRTGVVPK